ncbi:MAG: ELM1/GtrOC1 family putative glycosyltransferase, partial [Alphaproteobacteria bacterium]|nr:ELM1/GtrOC1 family putative glycosyltransferase [Alphaproteobacteria bacterium]
MDNCWIFADQGKTGSLKQAQALADALGFNRSVFEVELPLPWGFLPPQAGLLPINPLPLMITQPYPEYVIGIGRQSVIPTLYMKRYAKTIFIQDPKIH